jgi:hypothetical protein
MTDDEKSVHSSRDRLYIVSSTLENLQFHTQNNSAKTKYTANPSVLHVRTLHLTLTPAQLNPLDKIALTLSQAHLHVLTLTSLQIMH